MLNSVSRMETQAYKLGGGGEFCSMIHDRFDHDQHEALIRQLFHIRETGFVAKYVE
jgi:hypothetical protein